jgi:hypothetical protein
MAMAGRGYTLCHPWAFSTRLKWLEGISTTSSLALALPLPLSPTPSFVVADADAAPGQYCIYRWLWGRQAGSDTVVVEFLQSSDLAPEMRNMLSGSPTTLEVSYYSVSSLVLGGTLGSMCMLTMKGIVFSFTLQSRCVAVVPDALKHIHVPHQFDHRSTLSRVPTDSW